MRVQKQLETQILEKIDLGGKDQGVLCRVGASTEKVVKTI